MQEQVQIWQTDPFLSNLIAIYQQDCTMNPTSDDWITLKGQHRVREEVVK